ncbi:MAG: DUF1614 domain-containing protein [Dethiobacteria bacterium]|mgnify:CR=1 FL=1|jgi:uncharacterized membrane protein|nr:DUF1614 domain-containing protein [Bacillota bacterium]HOA35600.1 DUF1614 domain-containing protein [Bacillota bacterium]HOJ84348.1 DUF1614 domain-containing protein [Bacillota bacterium]HOL15426.1 DUF1614 domain-containing protein [Bacillota bacterium]
MYARAPGIMLVVIVTAIIYLILLHRVLDRLRMDKKTALILVALMYAGGFLPSLPLGGGLALNIGGMGIPLGICAYLVIKTPEKEEKLRGPLTALAGAALVWSLDRLLPINPGSLGYELDPLYLPAAAAGLIAYLLGRSRRAAFIGGVGSIFLMDLSSWVENMVRGFRYIPVLLGGGGVFDAALVAGVVGTLLAELIGEVKERLGGGPREEK